MQELKLHSEPYAPTGNIGDSGFKKLLGTPDLDVMQTVIRESIQNSCDAAKIGLGPDILIRLRTLTSSQIDAMRQRILLELPANPESRKHLAQFLNSSRPRVLEICDFNTTGLGGPTRADRIPVGEDTTDFIDFLRNVGTSRDTMHGGGTYGFGKVSLYLASQCSTIIVDSLAQKEVMTARRLMGCHLGPSHQEQLPGGLLKRFTGRHWWGEPVIDGDFVDPAFDDRAEVLSRAIGLPERNGKSGTSIMILDPCVGENDEGEIAGRIVENILFFFWPRMTEDVSPTSKISVRVELNGNSVPVPAPESFPPLDLFTSAIRKIRSGHESVQAIASQRPAKHLGKLAIEKGLRGRRVRLVSGESVFPAQCAHIAVMRPVELVVKYFEGQPLEHAQLEWGGVFIADDDDEVERAFANSEPPAHDDWQPKILPEKSPERTYVNVAVREIRKAAMSAGDTGQQHIEPGSNKGPSLTEVSDALGKFLGDNAEGGTSAQRRSSSGGVKSKRRLSRPFFIGLEEADGQRAAKFGLMARAGRHPIRVSLEAGLVIDGSFLSASEVDEARRPRLLRIVEQRTMKQLASEFIDIPETGGEYEVLVAIPEDCASSLRVSVETEG